MLGLAIGDLHTGSVLAPWPDGAPLGEGGTWQPNRFQRTLNRWWKEMVEDAQERKPDFIVVGGDTIEGGNHRNVQLVTHREDYQAGAAIELLTPLRELTDKFYMIRGTPWHVGESSLLVTPIARQLDATPMKAGVLRGDRYEDLTWPDLLLKFDKDCIAHFAHHVGSTGNPMYEATAPWKALRTIRQEMYDNFGSRAPNIKLVVRFHRHRLFRGSSNDLHVLIVPGWQLKTNYGFKKMPEMLPQIGYAWIEYDGRKITIDPVRYPLPKPHVEEL